MKAERTSAPVNSAIPKAYCISADNPGVSVAISPTEEVMDGGLALALGGAEIVASRIPPVTRQTEVFGRRSHELTYVLEKQLYVRLVRQSISYCRRANQ